VHAPFHGAQAPQDNHRQPLVLIADAHISAPWGNADVFFQMLTALEHGPADVMFLGDIFDLWIALPRYEKALHHAFLAWCRRQKRRRRIGFIEGNHEFFLAQTHREAFTWCTHRPWWRDDEGNLFCHGDRINRLDRNYLAFRKLTKNPISRTVIRWLPFGPSLVHHVKTRMKGANQDFRKALPLDDLRAFGEARFAEGVDRVFLGHFHHRFDYQGARGGELHTLPDWFSEGWISVLTADRNGLRQGPWRDILPLA